MILLMNRILPHAQWALAVVKLPVVGFAIQFMISLRLKL